MNVAPRVIIGIRSGTRTSQDIDLEQTVGLLQGMAERSNAEYQGSDDFNVLISHMDPFLEPEDRELGEEGPDSPELDSASISTGSVVRRLLQPLNQLHNQTSLETANSPVGPMSVQDESFSQTYVDLEIPVTRSSQSSRTEDSSLDHMILE